MRKGGRIRRGSINSAVRAGALERLEDRRLFAAYGPADGIGYIANPYPYESIDLVEGAPGVALPILTIADDGEVAIDLGINPLDGTPNTFTFYGHTYTGSDQLWVGSNGYLSFGRNELVPFLNDDLTGTNPEAGVLPTAAIAPLWDDLYLNHDPNDEVLYKFDGNRLIIEWSEAHHFSTDGSAEDALTFQAILELNTGDRNGSIVFNYVDVDRAEDFILSPTVGIKDAGTGDPDRLLIAYGAVNEHVASGRAILVRYNDAPVARADAVVTIEDRAVAIAPLSNDSDADGDPLSLLRVSNPTHGSLTANADGSFTYTPHANYFGADSFTYRVSDGEALSQIVTVSIAVAPVNDAPVAVSDAATTDEDVTTTVDVLGNDSDVEGDALSPAVVDGPAHGTAVVNADGTIIYTPAANYYGDDSFTYEVSDGHGGVSGVATVSVRVAPVNDAPVTENDSATTAEDTPVTLNLLANDSDVDGDALSADVLSGPSHGRLSVNTDGSFTYTPDANYNGSDSFTYRVSDGSLSSGAATVSLTVTPVNDAPVSAADLYATNEDTAVTVVAAGVLANDSDLDGDALTAVLVSGPSDGSLTLNADGSFTYTPAANFHGTDSFSYRSDDGALAGTVSVVTIDVAAVNDAPAASDDHYATTEDGSLNVSAGTGVLGNDADVDGDALTAVLVSGPSSGSLVLHPNGSFLYTPDANFNGSDGFTYRAEDGSGEGNVATVAIEVASANDGPVAVADVVNVNEDATATGNVLANDTDVEDGRPGRAELVNGPTRGTLTLNADGSFSYTPGANYFGTDSFIYRAVDAGGAASEAVVIIRISEVNDSPVAADDAATVANDAELQGGVLPNDVDPDNEDGLAGNEDTLSAELVSGTSHGALTFGSDGRFTYRANAGFTGTDTFTYRVRDGRGLAGTVATVSIEVTPAATPPPPPAGIQLVPDVTQPGKTALVIYGTAAAELIAVAPATGGVEVYLGANSQGVFNPTGRIVIYGRGGNDAILIAGSVSRQVWAYGDEGNDVIKLGSGGGLAFGGAGSDAIVGGTGRDVIVGGENADLLVGNPGDDILVSAMTIYDDRSTFASHEDAWAKLYAEWASGRTFAERVNNLKGCTSTGLNGSYLLSTAFLVDDHAADSIDILCGSSGSDWLIYKLGEDLAVGMSSTEAAVDGGIA
jgi:VCBS repeat-containing protein